MKVKLFNDRGALSLVLSPSAEETKVLTKMSAKNEAKLNAFVTEAVEFAIKKITKEHNA